MGGGVMDPVTLSLSKRYARLVSGISEATVTNLVYRGDFSGGAWSAVGASLSFVDNTGIFTAVEKNGNIRSTVVTTSGHDYYIKALVKADSPMVSLLLPGTPNVYHSGSGEWEWLSAVVTAPVNGTTTLRINDGRDSGWTPVSVRWVVMIDLTAAFGEGYIPTATQMDEIIASSFPNGWFEGSSKILPTSAAALAAPLSGRTIVTFGDSITANGFYPQVIARALKAKVINVGIGGTRMAEHNSTYNPFSMYKLADAIATGDWSSQLANQSVAPTAVARLTAIDWAKVDIVTVAFGQNDFAGGIDVGTAESPMDGNTWCGAIDYTVDRILTAYPHIQMLFIGPYWRARIVAGDGKDADTNPNNIGRYLIEYVDALIERCHAHKLPVLDLYRTSGINKYTHERYLSDGLHLAAPGSELIGGRIARFIESNAV